VSEFKIIDKKGVWVVNGSEFALPDYVRHGENPGSELVMLQPGVPTKILLSDFLKSQATLKILTHDPITGDEIPGAVQAAADVAAETSAETETAPVAEPKAPVTETGKKK
jgi:hypothetical protein